MLASTLVTLALVLLGYAAISRPLSRARSSPPRSCSSPPDSSPATACFGVLDFHADNHTVSLLAEATLAVVLFTDASRIDLRALRRESAVPMRLLGIGLPLTIVAGLIAGVVVLPSLLVVEALVLAIVLAPTDAALGQAVVTDARLPSRIRQGLNVESGLNDGLCVPLLAIALAVAQADVDALTASAPRPASSSRRSVGASPADWSAVASPPPCSARRRDGSSRTGRRSSPWPVRHCRTGLPTPAAAAASSPPSSAVSCSGS